MSELGFVVVAKGGQTAAISTDGGSRLDEIDIFLHAQHT
jgi:hypothetical protein